MYEICLNCPKLGKPCKGPNFYALTIAQQIEWIKKMKTILGWTNSKLAEESKTPKGTIDSLLSGNRTGANIETLRLIFGALIGNFSDGLPCPNPPTEESIALEEKLAKQTETITQQAKAIEHLENEIDILRKHIKQSDSLHASDKENAIKEYKKAFVFQRILIIILAILAVLSISIFLFL